MKDDTIPIFTYYLNVAQYTFYDIAVLLRGGVVQLRGKQIELVDCQLISQ